MLVSCSCSDECEYFQSEVLYVFVHMCMNEKYGGQNKNVLH